MYDKKFHKRGEFQRQFQDPVEQKLNRQRKHQQREKIYREYGEEEFYDEEFYEDILNIRYR